MSFFSLNKKMVAGAGAGPGAQRAYCYKVKTDKVKCRGCFAPRNAGPPQ